MTPTAREMWEAVERYHQLCYWAPEVREEGAKAGLKGFWMNYFASRAAPLGPVSAATVQALFFYYSSDRVKRAIPDAWNYASPEKILLARYRAMDRALRRELDSLVASETIETAAQMIREVTERISGLGKTLFEGWNSLPWPEQPHLALWHGCTVLREHRSGSHLIALAIEGLNGPESVISQVAVGEAPAQWIQDEAGWSNQSVEDAKKNLQSKGWLDADGEATSLCYEGRARIETTTDELDSKHWELIGTSKCNEIVALMAILNSHLPKDDQLDWREIYDS